MRADFEALRETDHQPDVSIGRKCGAHPCTRFAQRLRRTGKQNDLGSGERSREVRRDCDGRGQRKAGQVVGVFPCREERRSLLGAARSERHGMPGASEVQCEGRAPSSGPDDDKFHAQGLTTKYAKYTKKMNNYAVSSSENCSPPPCSSRRGTLTYFKNAGIFSPAIICSKVSRVLMSSNALPLTRTSAAMARVL